ncbi:MAG: 2-octaprenyl-3-methyl-6-methoxy-1,4-benzoquinol hydroxylase [Gammaproteobacteria bacterium (ex Lamellibrachia satsuma)]|nr:MAG: UbiH/UbiF/VisC/COQ6 family ubiquinone biosynthesis hydroxylase [Gammaproteobacteria bacterium (ex Lamellibrachia satsuma)]RRS33159.1 MAG: 2-octaprenyl-3-methyl-6-methoxy-1,4-benzoquinol hydroxylase [Gammaproteobacteria bacterium (ex Lamellibrachia satsuma)]RRS36304.1 MAG: 2-octaprenyl-3-methyl-6-methoxy-1,4-benzoquinol hydroxylase [Gammaproteobacteria bacterium (ex Lamellibrachia satsuma)]
MSEQRDSFDLIVVGGGMVGSALGCAMADAGFDVCVLELREPQTDWPDDEVDLRVSALTRASQQVLENLGAWDRMCEKRVSPYTDMHVWDAGGNGSIHFSCHDVGESNLGHIVENRVTQRALWERLATYDNVTRLCPAEVADLEMGPRPSVRLKDGTSLQVKLVVGADGRESLIRRMAAIGTRGWDYDQHAIVATVRPVLHHQNTAWQRFMPTGPLAFLPIDDGRCSIVWSTSPLLARELMALDDADFCRELTQASERMLGDVLEVGPRAAFPLRLGHAETYIREGLALVGDAAHAIHPLAGQGVNLGFLDAAQLAEVLIEARQAGRQIGSLATLRRYERARKGANMGMLGAMDFFKRFFSNEVSPLKLARNLGLSLVDNSGPLKQLVVRRAMGMVGELPKLAQRDWDRSTERRSG